MITQETYFEDELRNRASENPHLQQMLLDAVSNIRGRMKHPTLEILCGPTATKTEQSAYRRVLKKRSKESNTFGLSSFGPEIRKIQLDLERAVRGIPNLKTGQCGYHALAFFSGGIRKTGINFFVRFLPGSDSSAECRFLKEFFQKTGILVFED